MHGGGGERMREAFIYSFVVYDLLQPRLLTRWMHAPKDLTQIKKDVSQGVRRMPGENRLAEDIPGRGKFYCNACR